MTKKCRSCNKDKQTTEFSKEKRNKDGLKSYCRPCMSLKTQEYSRRHKEERAAYSKQYRLYNREKLLKYERENYQTNKAEKQAYGRAYRKIYLAKAKDKVAKLARDSARRRRKTEPMFRLIMNLRRRLNHLLKGSKSKKTMELTGCDSKFLKQYLEEKFSSGMTWENYGEWHVDHILPLSKVNLFDQDELEKVCHYTNLQPLWGEENIRWSNKNKKLEASNKESMR